MRWQQQTWSPHPDPALEADLTGDDADRLVTLLADPRLRDDPWARLRVLDRMCALGGRDPRLLEAWMQSMLLGNRPRPVWALTRGWPEDGNCDAGAQLLAAQVAQAVGQREEARRRYRGLVERHPGWVDAWQKYIEFERHGPHRLPRPAALDAVLRAPPAPYDEEKAAFALAACIDADSPGEAFALAERAHALKRRRIGPWHRAGFEAALRADRTWTPAPAGAPAREVFVVGLPRSGTTLLASLLGAHPSIANVGEQNLLGALVARSQRAARPPDAADMAWATAWYRAATGDIAGDAPVVVDKLPGNAERCGLALALLPGAIVVHVERDIDDCALSIHQRDFEFGCAYAGCGDDLGTYAGRLGAHLGHWQATAPGRVLHLRFETLVAEPERALAPVLDALGLHWDPAMLEFWREDAPTATYSEGQVRSPLDLRGVGSGARYLPEAEVFLRTVREAAAVAARSGAMA